MAVEEKRFRRTVEDFACEHCAAPVHGDGYTNHCPECLWSKHVDVNPGDRAEKCGGLMEPVGLVQKAGQFVLTHRCLICSKESGNRAAPADKIGELFLKHLPP
ncbi:MAG: RNHCP domain-containing protein [Candidatus Taylorbacteria bacterium]|nr:RNHCP domain-containing protein [Candidatus Taylorbacteria bacterium]